MDRCIDWKKKLSTDQESDIRIIKYKTSCQKIDNKDMLLTFRTFNLELLFKPQSSTKS